MSRINTNVQSILAQRILSQQNIGLTRSLERLSTGLAINRGSDDPAGLIASETLRSETISLKAAIGNAERANQVINIAEGGLQEISSMLLEVQSLITQSANDGGLSTQEKQANQLQIDSILQSIDRIAATTSFQGTKLLNGTYDFTITSQHANLADYTIDAAKLAKNETRTLNTVVTASAQHGSLFLSAGGAGTAITFGGNAAERFTFEIAGGKGSREFSFASGTTFANVAAGINTFKEVTGVSAAVSGLYIQLRSTEFGSQEFVRFDLVDDAGGNYLAAIRDASATDEDTLGATTTTLAAMTGAIRDAGQNIAGTINGISGTGDGRILSVNSEVLAVDLELTDTAAQALAGFDAFTITLPGAKFSIGPNVDISNQVSIGIKNVAARNLGNVSSGYLDTLATGQSNNLVDGNLDTAQKVIDAAVTQVSQLRGRFGAFQKNVIESSIRALGVALENTSAAESGIRDTNFASETAALTRSQILVNAGTNVLAIANAQPQSVLGLLG